MRRPDFRNKTTLAITCVLALLVGSSIWITYTVASFGLLSVKIHDDDVDLSIQMPAAVVMLVMPFVPDEVLREAVDEINEAAPVARAFIAEISRCPDFVIVSVDSDDERVKVRKKGRHLLVEVDDGESSVRVKMPLKAADYVMSRLEKAAA